MTYFTLKECNDIIELFSKLQVTQRDETPRRISYEFCSIPFSKEYIWIFNVFNSFLEDSFDIKVVKNLDTIHLFKYSVGDKFLKHKDIYYPGQVYNVGVNLNDNYKGGDFVLYEPYQIIPKHAGKLYTFKNTVQHEVIEVTEGIRWSLIGFYFYDHLNITPPII